MAHLVLVLDVTVDTSQWDPHDVIDAIITGADSLPTFVPGATWSVTDSTTTAERYEGTYVSCEWEDG